MRCKQINDINNPQPDLLCEGHINLVIYLAFSPDGSKLASASVDQTTRIWDAQTGDCLHTFQTPGETTYNICFSPDGTTLATASVDQTICLWYGFYLFAQ